MYLEIINKLNGVKRAMLYLWEMPRNCKQKAIAEYDENLSTDRFLFRQGIKLDSQKINKRIIFHHNLPKNTVNELDSIPNNSASPLVNQKVVDILLKLAPEDVQFFDSEIRCNDGIVMDYKLLNLTSKITGIDYEKSICEYIKEIEGPIGFKYLTYKPGCMGSHKLARDAEYLGNLLITDEIKQFFEKEQIKGVWFAKPEEWYSLASA